LANTGRVNDEKGIYNAGDSAWGQPAELFRRYGISAPCGYKWLRAYQEKGFAGLEQKSRRPRSHPDEIGTKIQAQILSLRDKQPAWGGRKLKRRLEDLGMQRVPAASTITESLRRNGRLNMAHPSAQGPWQRFEYAAPKESKVPVRLIQDHKARSAVSDTLFRICADAN
jgi:hypothetical protein